MDPLITAGELGDYLQRSVPDATADLAVRGASGAIRGYCRWAIGQETGVTLVVDGSGSLVQPLPTLHLTAVASVAVDGVTVDPATYRWTARGQLYGAGAVWPLWSRVEAVVTHGYDPVPDVLRLVALGLAARYAGNPESLQLAQVGSVHRRFPDPGLTTVELALLDEYRLP